MALFQRGEVWYYLFYVNGRRYRGSTKTTNPKKATRIYERARVRAESGESLKPQRAPVIQAFVPKFLEWVDKAMLESKTKADYKNGCRLILKSGLLGMRLDQISQDDIDRVSRRDKTGCFDEARKEFAVLHGEGAYNDSPLRSGDLHKLIMNCWMNLHL